MPDQPEVVGGTRQPSGHFNVRFDLNDAFVEQVGQAKAEEFLAVLMEVADSHGHRPMGEIEKALTTGFRRIGVEPTEQELLGFADQIKRSDQAVHPDAPNPYDTESPRHE